MLVVFAVIIGGIITGRLLSSRRLVFVPRSITVVIYALLFLLGLEAGSDPEVVGGIVTLGSTAFIIFTFSVTGSVGASWLLWRHIRGRRAADGAKISRTADDAMITKAELSTGPECPGAVDRSNSALTTEKPSTMWNSMKGSLLIVAFFAAGCVAGLFALLPLDLFGSRASMYVLCVLMFCVGITLGSDTTLTNRIRQLDRRLALLPVMTAIGTLAGAALAAPLLASLTATDTLAVGSGFGYYSLSSIFIADFKGVELGTVALLCNIMREIFTLLAAPLIARWFGPLAAISIGGATTFDVTLPVITQAAGKQYAVVSIFHGCMLDLSVPLLVTFFCTL